MNSIGLGWMTGYPEVETDGWSYNDDKPSFRNCTSEEKLEAAGWLTRPNSRAIIISDVSPQNTQHADSILELTSSVLPCVSPHPMLRFREEGTVDSAKLVLALLDEAYEKKTWHGPNLKQSIKGVTAKQAAWRPGAGRHNIWEVALHAAYWKYAVRRRIEGGKRGSFVLKGSNFFARPEAGKLTETAWSADRNLLEREHRALQKAMANVLRTPRGAKLLPQLYGVAFHDIYHAGQIRLLRRLEADSEG